MAAKPKRDAPALPLGDLLRDLALLRAADVDLTSVLAESKPTSASTKDSTSTQDDEVSASVERSQEFAKDARAALRVLNRGEVEKEGNRIDEVRSELEEIVQGLEGASVN